MLSPELQLKKQKAERNASPVAFSNTDVKQFELCTKVSAKAL